MSIIVLSRLPYTSGEAVAHNVASALGYASIDQEVFREAAQRSQLPEEKLHKAFCEAPSLFGMSPGSRKRCIAHVQAALSAHLLKDDVVYHGPFGHLLIKGVSHVLRVRVTAQLEDRVALKVKRDGASSQEAEKAIIKEDKERLMLAKLVFEVNDSDTNLFDLVINTSRVDVDTAVAIITETVKHDRYRPMTYSLHCLEDLELSHRVKASLVDIDPQVEVQADKGNIRIRAKAPGLGRRRRLEEIHKRSAEQEGVKKVEVEMVEDLIKLLTDRKFR